MLKALSGSGPASQRAEEVDDEVAGGRKDVSALEVFRQMVDATFERRLVPFLGAGVSLDSRIQEDQSFLPTIGHLKTLVKCKEGDTDAPFEQLAERWVWNAEEEPGAKCKEAKELAFNLCEQLKVACFTELTPLRAHYAIAALALEGLLEEVITTNWDTNIEKAVQELSRCENRSGSDRFTVIYDAASYRKSGAKRRSAGGHASLRLYKINGCAALYKKRKREVAQSVVITERQLQDFGERRWARDLLHDRARSRTLLFSGFGSAEPQVQHTLLRLAEDVRPQGEHGDADEQPVLFVVQYEKKLTFAQKQLLRAAAARGPDGRLGPSLAALTGVNGECFGETDKLPADAFWTVLLEHALERLLEKRYLAPRSPCHVWLTQHVPDPRLQVSQLLEWLFLPEERQRGGEGRPPWARTRLDGLLGPMLSPAVERERAGSAASPDAVCALKNAASGFHLGRWMEAMKGRTVADDKVPQYIPLRDPEEPLLPLATLFTLKALSQLGDEGKAGLNSSWSVRVRPTPQGLCVVLGRKGPSVVSEGDDAPQEQFAVFLVADSWAVREETFGADVDAGFSKFSSGRVRYQIVVPSTVGPQRPRSIIERSGTEAALVGHCYELAAGDLLRAEARASLAILVAKSRAAGRRIQQRLRRSDKNG